jgi:quinol monooxygenase YgiN
MLIRIVEMYFREDAVHQFMEVFNESCMHIRSFPGCMNLELLQDLDDSTHIFTYSFWENEEALLAYRNSELFLSTWSKTKILFDKKPNAWSLNRTVQLG